jgi:hypothetical protein
MQQAAADAIMTSEAAHPAQDFFVSTGCIDHESRQLLSSRSSSNGFSHSVLEVNSSNIMNFAQGEFSLVHDDLSLLLPPTISTAALSCLEDLGAESAFHTRRDLVNFKKICLHMQEAGTHTCKDLKQLCAFFRTDTQSHESFFTPVDRYGVISDTMQECAGALDAVADGRRMSKALCCVPRMPNKPLSEYLTSCPEQLQSFKNVRDAEEFLSTTQVLQLMAWGQKPQHISPQIHPPPRHCDGCSGSPSAGLQSIDYNTAFAVSQMLDHTWSTEYCLQPSAEASFPPFSLSPVYVVAASMTARGGWKALRMQRVLHHVASSLQQLLLRISEALERLHALPSLELVKVQLLKQREDAARDGSTAHEPDALAHHRVVVGCAIKRRRYISLLTGTIYLLECSFLFHMMILLDAGTVAALENVTQHLAMMLTRDHSRLFVAGDNDARSAAGAHNFCASVYFVLKAFRNVLPPWFHHSCFVRAICCRSCRAPAPSAAAHRCRGLAVMACCNCQWRWLSHVLDLQQEF